MITLMERGVVELTAYRRLDERVDSITSRRGAKKEMVVATIVRVSIRSEMKRTSGAGSSPMRNVCPRLESLIADGQTTMTPFSSAGRTQCPRLIC